MQRIGGRESERGRGRVRPSGDEMEKASRAGGMGLMRGEERVSGHRTWQGRGGEAWEGEGKGKGKEDATL